MTDKGRVDPVLYTRRSSNRLPFYDYRSSGAYFVTLCTNDRQPAFNIPSMRAALLENWRDLPQRFPGITLDEFVVMPDHVHGILWLDGNMKSLPTLGEVIGAFKSLVTVAWRKYHRELGIQCTSRLWHRDYFEHVIRNEEDLRLTREYIVNNPLKALLLQEQRREEVERVKKYGDR